MFESLTVVSKHVLKYIFCIMLKQYVVAFIETENTMISKMAMFFIKTIAPLSSIAPLSWQLIKIGWSNEKCQKSK